MNWYLEIHSTDKFAIKCDELLQYDADMVIESPILLMLNLDTAMDIWKRNEKVGKFWAIARSSHNEAKPSNQAEGKTDRGFDLGSYDISWTVVWILSDVLNN